MARLQDFLNDLSAHVKESENISALFDAEPNRLSRFVLEEGPLRFDSSKQALSRSGLDALLSVAAKMDLDGWRARFFAGEAINTSEDRAVLHPALRGVGGSDEVKAEVSAMRERMSAFATKIRKDGKFKAVVHIGIGGSDLGPRLVADAFAASGKAKLDLRFAENVDGASINDALDGLDPRSTLVVVVSKSFTTQETRMNAQSARLWLQSSLKAVSYTHLTLPTTPYV